MSNKTQLAANNTTLDEYITRINAAKNVAASLPEAESDGVINETCEVTVSGSASQYYPINIAYTSIDSNGKVIGVNQTVSTSSVTVICVKGSTLAVKFKSSYSGSSLTNATVLFFTSPVTVYKLNDTATTATIINKPSGGGSVQ